MGQMHSKFGDALHDGDDQCTDEQEGGRLVVYSFLE
jgi:hypothetical protein